MHFITLYNPGFVKRGRSLMVSPLIAYWWVSSPSHARDKQRGQTAAESARVIRQVWTRRQTRSFILDSISLVLREFGLISGLLTAKREKQLWEERKMNERWAKHSESNPSQFMIRLLSQHRDLCRNGLEIEIRVSAAWNGSQVSDPRRVQRYKNSTSASLVASVPCVFWIFVFSHSSN